VHPELAQQGAFPGNVLIRSLAPWSIDGDLVYSWQLQTGAVSGSPNGSDKTMVHEEHDRIRITVVFERLFPGNGRAVGFHNEPVLVKRMKRKETLSVAAVSLLWVGEMVVEISDRDKVLVPSNRHGSGAHYGTGPQKHPECAAPFDSGSQALPRLPTGSCYPLPPMRQAPRINQARMRFRFRFRVADSNG